ncbi:MAG: endo alpha-1,4 polygalactosaminidase [Acidimicrobiales bacterium]
MDRRALFGALVVVVVTGLWAGPGAAAASAAVPAVPAPSTVSPPPAASAAGAVHRATAPTWWVPPLGNQPWQWELSHPLRLTNARDLGTDDRLPDGSQAPAPVIYDIDGIINPASTVAWLHTRGKRAVCYIEVGAAGNYYSAADEGTTTTYYSQLEAAGVFGGKVPGYPEYYLDIRSPSTVSIIESMIERQCAAKGFDAVETDIDEEYTSNSGFPLTRSVEEQYMATLAGYMHGLGLGWWIKNPDDTGDSYASDMYPLADAVLTEQCNQYSSCGLLSAYFGHKAVFNAEYHRRQASFCPEDDALGFNGARFNLGLTGRRMPCR